MNTHIEALAKHPFLAGLPPEFLPLLNLNARTKTFQPGETLFMKGQKAQAFYLLTEGRVDLETPYTPGNGLLTVKTLRAGDPLGWSWFFPPFLWHFSAQAVSAGNAIVLDGPALCEAARIDARFGFWLSRRIGEVLLERLQTTRLRLLDACQAAEQLA